MKKHFLPVSLFFLFWSIVQAQSNKAVNTLDMAQAVLEKGLAEIDLGYYPGTLLFHGMAEMAVHKNDPTFLKRTTELLKSFRTGGIKGHGSYISYQYGGSGTSYLVWKGLAESLKPQITEGAKNMYADQKRSSEDLLVPPWTKEGMDQVFIDMAFAVTPYFLYAGLELDNREYIDMAVKETMDLFRILKDDTTGLLHQARGFRHLGSISEDNWSRGNGWGAFAIATLVRDLPESHPERREVEQVAKAFFRTVVEYQDKEGLWHQEMTDPDSYIETSGSGLLLFGLGIMLEKGLLDSTYSAHFKKGLQGYAPYIGSDGSVSHTCSGCLSPGKGTKEDYRNQPWIYNDEHAFGPAVLAFTQAAKMGVDTIVPSKDPGSFTIMDNPKMPRTYVRHARGRDVAWENDRMAYRVFGPTVRDKVRNSIDVWAKSVPYPILDKWYRLNAEGKDYHKDRGEGCDFYHAGKTTGCGGMALWHNGKAHQPETFDKFRIRQNQDDKIAFSLDYDTWNVPGMELKAQMVIEMEMGTQLFKVTGTVKSEKDQEITLALGLTTFGKQDVYKDEKIGALGIWETMDTAHGSLGSAIITDPKILEGFANDENSQYMLIRVRTNVPFSYYAGAGWEKGHHGFKNGGDWQRYIQREAKKVDF